MALAFTARGTLFSTTGATSYAETQSYTPASTSLMVAFVSVSATSPVAPPTVAGHNLTWTALTLSANALSTTHRIDVYVAKSSGSASNAAFTISGYGGNQTGAAIIVYEVTGADVSGTAANAIVQNPTNNGTGTSASVTLSAASYSANRPLGFFVHLDNSAPTGEGGNWVSTTGNYNTPATGVIGEANATAFDTSVTATTANVAWRGVALEVKSAPLAYSLTADPGSVSITGTVAALMAALILTASSGAISLADTAASLLFGPAVTASAGAVDITGTDATLTHGSASAQASVRSLLAFWLGGASTRGANTTITADPGSVVIAGTAATLTATRSLTADPGSVDIVGTAATLAHGSTVTADPGAVDISGTAALTTTRLLTADPGAVTITGTDAGVYAGWRIAADPGAVVIAAPATGLSYSGADKSITAGEGAVTITGTDAGLLHGSVFVADPGAVTISGTAATFVRTLRFPVDAGSVTITGTDAGLAVGHVVTADPGAVAITGTDAALLAARTLTAEPGAVVISGTPAVLVSPIERAGDTVNVEFNFRRSVDAEMQFSRSVNVEASFCRSVDVEFER